METKEHEIYLVEHPLEPHSCSTFILGSTVHPVQIEDHIHVPYDRGKIVSAFPY